MHAARDYNVRMSILPYAHKHVEKIHAYKPGKPISETARELHMRPDDIVKLASNENPLGASPVAVQAMQNTARDANLYPDGSSHVLRSKVAKHFKVGMGQVVAGNGSSELIEILCHTCLGPDTELVAARYSFTMYSLMCQLFGATFVEVENKPDWSHDLRAILRAVTSRTRLIFITNPTNPVGTMVQQAELDDFMAHVPEHVIVAFDEAYIHYADPQPDTLRYVQRGQNAVVMRTFSKAYGLAGVRAGVAITTEEIAELMNKARSPFNMNSLAQAAAVAALDDEQHLHSSVQLVRSEMKRYEQAFCRLGLSYIPSQGNFVLVKVGNGERVFNECLKRGVILRPMNGYGLHQYIRISVGTPEQNTRCLRVLAEALQA